MLQTTGQRQDGEQVLGFKSQERHARSQVAVDRCYLECHDLPPMIVAFGLSNSARAMGHEKLAKPEQSRHQEAQTSGREVLHPGDGLEAVAHSRQLQTARGHLQPRIDRQEHIANPVHQARDPRPYY